MKYLNGFYPRFCKRQNVAMAIPCNSFENVFQVLMLLI